MKLQIIICGIPDEFVEHASREEMLEMTGLDKKGILAKVKTSLS
jgi:deoxyxylulose-5-phosphate synthase